MINARWIASRAFGVVAAPLMLGAALVVIAPGAASASTCVSWTGVQPPNPGSSYNELAGVTVLSPCDTWAVGWYFNATSIPMAHTLIEHWNGASWRHVPSPDPGGSADDNRLMGVAATSAIDAWAVGSHSTSTASQTLIEHWNGTAWKHIPSPNPRSNDSELLAVSATSASNAWAVGDYFTAAAAFKTLIEHWNGTAWKLVASPSPGAGGNAKLLGVSATSAGNAWAVGSFFTGTAYKTLIEHWNGTAWKFVASPSPGAGGVAKLLGVSATSAGNAWAVGNYVSGNFELTLIEHWNGTAWKRVPSPNSSSANFFNVLNGVAATSAGNAWAVGDYTNGTVDQTLIERWNGTAWKRVPSPKPSSSHTLLNGVAATSSTNIWAVGFFTGTATETLALHCC